MFAADEQLVHYVDFPNNVRNLSLPSGEQYTTSALPQLGRSNLGSGAHVLRPEQRPFPQTDAADPLPFPDCGAVDFEDRLEPKEPTQVGCTVNPTPTSLGLLDGIVT